MKIAFVLIPTVVATLSLVGCSEEQSHHRVCSDSDWNRVEDARCEQQRQQHSGIGGGYLPYYWFYMNSGYGAPAIGGRISPSIGGMAPAPGISYSSGVSRGGFGASASAFGGGGE